jgi:hypothetical protein
MMQFFVGFGYVVAVLACTLVAQTSMERGLREALDLSDLQLARIESAKEAARIAVEARRNGSQTAGRVPIYIANRTEPFRDPNAERAQSVREMRRQILTATQLDRLSAIEKVLERQQEVAEMVSLGVIDFGDWPGGALCYYPVRAGVPEFFLSDGQVRELERLRRSPGSESGPKPARETVLRLLDPAQRASVERLESDLRMVREGIGLGLILSRAGGEALCN